MSDPVAYDKAKWHFNGSFPSGLPIEQAFVHTGLFLGWLIDRDLLDRVWWEGDEPVIEAFKRREVTGPKVFEETCDGALVDNMLNDEGNAFAQHYFAFETGNFLKDYDELFTENLPSPYHVADTWENYFTLKVRIDQRFAEWKAQAT